MRPADASYQKGLSVVLQLAAVLAEAQTLQAPSKMHKAGSGGVRGWQCAAGEASCEQ